MTYYQPDTDEYLALEHARQERRRPLVFVAIAVGAAFMAAAFWAIETFGAEPPDLVTVTVVEEEAAMPGSLCTNAAQDACIVSCFNSPRRNGRALTGAECIRGPELLGAYISGSFNQCICSYAEVSPPPVRPPAPVTE